MNNGATINCFFNICGAATAPSRVISLVTVSPCSAAMVTAGRSGLQREFGGPWEYSAPVVHFVRFKTRTLFHSALGRTPE